MGCFSWVTQDTDLSILIDGDGPKSLQEKMYYMWDNKGNCWAEPKYEGLIKKTILYYWLL